MLISYGRNEIFKLEIPRKIDTNGDDVEQITLLMILIHYITLAALN